MELNYGKTRAGADTLNGKEILRIYSQRGITYKQSLENIIKKGYPTSISVELLNSRTWKGLEKILLNNGYQKVYRPYSKEEIGNTGVFRVRYESYVYFKEEVA